MVRMDSDLEMQEFESLITSRAVLRCPSEIWRMIFDDVVAAICTDPSNSPTDLPINSRDFTLNAVGSKHNTNLNLKPSIPVGFSSTWSRVLRVRKQLVLVCRTWWNVGSADIYTHVYLHRIGQLPALVQTLESSQHRNAFARQTRNLDSVGSLDGNESRSNKGSGHGRWIMHITVDCNLPDEWTRIYCEGFVRLLKHCPNLEALDIRSIKSSPFKRPFSSVIAGRNCPLLVRRNGYGSPAEEGYLHLPRLKHLSLGEPYLIPPTVDQCLLNSFVNLVSLKLAIFRSPYVTGEIHGLDNTAHQHAENVELPNLQRLTIIVFSGEQNTREVNVLGENWRMPCLSCLSIVSGDASADDPPPRARRKDYYRNFDALRICVRHGKTIEHLFIEERIGSFFGFPEFAALFGACPKLVNAAMPCFMRDLRKAVPTLLDDQQVVLGHLRLKTLTIFMAKKHPKATTNNAEALIYQFAKAEKFPSMTTVCVVRVNSQKRPRRQPGLRIVKNWRKVYQETHVRFEVHKHSRDVPLVGAAFAEDGDDASDEDFVPDSDSGIVSQSDSDIESNIDLDELSILQSENPYCPSHMTANTTGAGLCCSRRKLNRHQKDMIQWDDAIERFGESTKCGVQDDIG